MKRKLLSAFAMILLLGISRAAFAERAVPIHPDMKIEYIEDVQSSENGGAISLLDESAEVSSDNRYGRTAIGELENGTELIKIYDALVSGVRNFDKKITVSINFDLSIDDAQEFVDVITGSVTQAIIGDNPELFWFGKYDSRYHILYGDEIGCVCNSEKKVKSLAFTPQYGVGQTVAAEMTEDMENAANSFIKQANITDGMTDYDKALALHDVICANLAYDDSQSREWIHTVYGAFVNKYAVCDGYSKAYQYLLNKSGIDSHIATGAGNGGSHAWNLVKLGDKWYYTDVTWDDQPYLDFYYEYFNLTEEQLTAKDHEINKTDYPLPICDTRFYIYKSKSSDMRAEWYTEPYTNDSGKVQFNAKIRDSVTVIRVYYDKNGVLIHQNSLFNRSINGTGNNGETVIFGEAVSENIKKSVAETKYMLWRGGTIQPICDIKIAS